MKQDDQDRLWNAVCAVTAVYETYSADDTARPKQGLFPSLDRLVAACRALTDLSDELVPVSVDHDPTPWCSGCGAMRKSNCDCGPIAANE